MVSFIIVVDDEWQAINHVFKKSFTYVTGLLEQQLHT